MAARLRRYLGLVVAGWTAVGPFPIEGRTKEANPREGAGITMLSAGLLEAKYRLVELTKEILRAKGRVIWAARGTAEARSLEEALARSQWKGLTPSDVEIWQLPHSHIWLRDFGPIVMIRSADSRTPSVIWGDAIYSDPSNPEHDRVPSFLAAKYGLSPRPLEAELDGGNVLIQGDHCLSSTMDADRGSVRLTAGALQKLGCGSVDIITNAPHRHLDMWVSYVGPRHLLVSQIDERTLALASKIWGDIPPDLAALHQRLEAKAKELGKIAKVDRIPLPLPHRNVFRSYTNSIVVNETVIVPKYRTFGWSREPYPDHSLTGFYEDQVKAAYQRAGFKVRFIEADGLIYNGGAFRCVSLQWPMLRPMISDAPNPRGMTLRKGI